MNTGKMTKEPENDDFFLFQYLERTSNMREVSTIKSQPIPTKSFSKDFDYLIREEPDKSDTEQATFKLQRHSKVYFN